MTKAGAWPDPTVEEGNESIALADGFVRAAGDPASRLPGSGEYHPGSELRKLDGGGDSRNPRAFPRLRSYLRCRLRTRHARRHALCNRRATPTSRRHPNPRVLLRLRRRSSWIAHFHCFRSILTYFLDPSVIEFQVSFRCPVSQKGLVAFFTELVPAAGRTAQLLDRGQQFFAGVVRQAPRTLLNNFRQPSEIMHDHRGLTRERFNGYDTKRFVCNRRHQARHRVIVKSPQLLLRLRSQEMDARIGGRLAPQLHGVSSAACDQQIVAWNLAPQGDEILHSFDVLQATHKQKIRPWVGAIHGLLPVAVRAREEIRQTLQRPLKPTLRMHAHAKFAGREELVDCRAFSLQ